MSARTSQIGAWRSLSSNKGQRGITKSMVLSTEKRLPPPPSAVITTVGSDPAGGICSWAIFGSRLPVGKRDARKGACLTVDSPCERTGAPPTAPSLDLTCTSVPGLKPNSTVAPARSDVQRAGILVPTRVHCLLCDSELVGERRRN